MPQLTDNDRRTNALKNQIRTTPIAKVKKRTAMPKRKRKKDNGSKKKGKYFGVSKNTKGFQARISIDGKQQGIGTFETPKEAAQAYDRAAIQAGRPTFKLNFLDQVPKNYKPKRKKPYSNNTTGFRNVVKTGKKFQARITISGETQRLGLFNTAKEAANANYQAVIQAKCPRSSI